MSKAATIIAERLSAAGCRYAFGIPGGEVIELMDAVKAAGIEVLLTKHENAAGFMAEGVFHHDGAPGILIATIGPGLANAVNVVANAMQDRVPLVVLTGCVSALDEQTYTHQVFDHRALLAPIAKAVFKVEHGAVGVIADKAVAICQEGQPGPVLLDVPIDVQKSDQGETPCPRRVLPSPMVPAEGADLNQARAWLAEAERPIVIAGVDALNDRSEQAVADFCRARSIPLITTYKAKGILPEDDPLALGGAGLSPKADAHLLPLVQQADLVILAGYDPIEMRIGWRDPWESGARVIEVSSLPNHHYMHQASLSFLGQVGVGLERLGSGVELRDTWPNGAPAATRAALKATFPGDETWGPAAVCAVAREALPRNAVITVDSGAHRILLSQMWEAYEPRGVLQSTALCTMGCALPLAMGRKLAEPGRPVVAFTGDAGLEMVLGELATLRDLALPIVVIVFVDEELALIELKQRNSGFGKLAVSFGATDFEGVAKAMGGQGVFVEDRAGLKDAIDEALQASGFTIIAARIGKAAYDGRF